MYAIAVAAADGAEARAARDRLAAGLAAAGRVGIVEVGDDDPDAGPAHGGTRVTLGSDGAWSASGDDLDLDAVLERLAPDHDYALVTGIPEADLPTVAVDDSTADALVAVTDPTDVDADEVRAALEGVEPLETLASLVARAKASPSADRAGAIATFTGRVRARDDLDEPETTHLEFEKYAGVAADRLAGIREELEARDGVFEVVMHHRTGMVEAGEDIVFVVVLAGHRAEAFRTVQDGIDRLKAEVPIFKKEVTLEDSFWLHERPENQQ